VEKRSFSVVKFSLSPVEGPVEDTDLHVDQQLQLLVRALYRAQGELHDRKTPLLHTHTN
jgi:hypothetical protein